MNFPFRNVRDVLGLHAKVSPHKTAIISYDSQSIRRELTYLEFVGKSHQVANFLYEDLGIKRGDTIAIASPNQENALLLYFASWVIGATVLSINHDTRDESLKQALQRSKTGIIFADHTLIDNYIPLVNSIEQIEGVIQIGGERRENILRFEDLASNRPTTFLGDESGAKGADIPITGGNERTARLSDIALITYKNGKLIQRSQGDLLDNANRYAQAGALTGNQVILASMPFHENFTESFIVPLLVGASIVMPENFLAKDLWHYLVKESAHSTVLDSQAIQQVVDSARKNMASGKMRYGGKIIQQDIKHFRYILITDPELSSQLACDFEDLFGVPLITAYKHPRTNELLSMMPINLAWTEHQKCLHGYDSPSIGTAIADIAIIDENGKQLESNKTGFIAFRTNNGDYQSTGERAYFQLIVDMKFYFLNR